MTIDLLFSYKLHIVEFNSIPLLRSVCNDDKQQLLLRGHRSHHSCSRLSRHLRLRSRHGRDKTVSAQTRLIAFAHFVLYSTVCVCAQLCAPKYAHSKQLKLW